MIFAGRDFRHACGPALRVWRRARYGTSGQRRLPCANVADPQEQALAVGTQIRRKRCEREDLAVDGKQHAVTMPWAGRATEPPALVATPDDLVAALRTPATAFLEATLKKFQAIGCPLRVTASAQLAHLLPHAALAEAVDCQASVGAEQIVRFHAVASAQIEQALLVVLPAASLATVAIYLEYEQA